MNEIEKLESLIRMGGRVQIKFGPTLILDGTSPNLWQISGSLTTENGSTITYQCNNGDLSVAIGKFYEVISTS